MSEEEKDEEAAGVRPQAEGEDKAAEYLAGWKRALADYDNVKKDMARERGEMRRDAIENAAEAFLPALEHFDAAVRFQPKADPPLADTPEWSAIQGWLQGILHIRRELEEAMKQLGVEPFGEAGETFDPMKHESAGSRAEEGKAPNAIVDVLRKGWKLGDRVIRPASVIVIQ